MCSYFSLSFPLSLLLYPSFCVLVNLPSFSHSEPYCSTFSIIRILQHDLESRPRQAGSLWSA
jgi:hypothetical protein